MLVGFPKILSHEGEDETNNMEYKKLLVSKGLCKIIELFGFEKITTKDDDQTDTKVVQKRGVENIAKRVVVPHSRVCEIVNGMLTSLFCDIEKFEDPEIEV